MNSRQLEYAILLSQLRSFSQVSEKLNISQPALSKQIMSLEKDLGVKLFDRNRIPLTLTPAGEHFIREAQRLLYREDQLLRSMEQFKSGEKGRLTIGVSPFRNLYLMPDIIRKIRLQYPGVQIILRETNSDQLRKEAAEGKFDFAIVNLPVEESVLEITPLGPEVLALAIPVQMADELPVEKDIQQIDFADCKDLPFVVVAQGQELRKCFDDLCARTNVTPETAVEVVGGISSAWSMARSGIGATLLPLQFVRAEGFDQQLRVFTLKNQTYSRQPVIVTRHDQYISAPARFAIDLLTESVRDKK